MPRTSISINERYNKKITCVIKSYMYMYDVDVPELATSAKVCKDTMYRRLQKPETFTIDELRRIVRKLRIPKDEIIPALLGAEVA